MKPTLDTIAYDFLTTIRQIHDDSDISLRTVKFWIQNSRAIWVTNELNKFKPVPTKFIQDLGIIELEAVDTSLTEHALGDKVLRSSVEMPIFLEAGNEPAITRVGPAFINSGSFKIIPYERVPYIGNGRFNSSTIYGTLINNYLYVFSRTTNSLDYAGMRKINIRGILADPTDAARFHFANNVACYTDTSEYPISDRLINYMKDIIIQTDAKIMLSLLPDKINNAHDDTAGTQSNQSGNQQPS